MQYTREDMRICGICILVYTRRYADMWNMYTSIHEKICRYVEYVYLYTREDMRICGYDEMFYND